MDLLYRYSIGRRGSILLHLVEETTAVTHGDPTTYGFLLQVARVRADGWRYQLGGGLVRPRVLKEQVALPQSFEFHDMVITAGFLSLQVLLLRWIRCWQYDLFLFRCVEFYGLQ